MNLKSEKSVREYFENLIPKYSEITYKKLDLILAEIVVNVIRPFQSEILIKKIFHNEDPRCETGCKSFTGGEKRHHKDCANYTDSFSQMYDNLKVENESKIKFNSLQLNVILSSLENELERYADTSGRFKKYPTKGTVPIIVNLKKQILQKLEKLNSVDLKTSEKWAEDCPFEILNADGWDRKNFHHSFFIEKISKKEFDKRLSFSTVQGKSLTRTDGNL